MNYVYLLLDPTNDYIPFYVGKGSGKRAWQHMKHKHENRYNRKKAARIKKILESGNEVSVMIWQDCLEKNAAYALEAKLIKRFRRKDIDLDGCLLNLTPGGYGAGAGENSINYGRKQSKETIQKRLANTSTAARIKASEALRKYNTENIKYGSQNGNFGKKHPGLNAGEKNWAYGLYGENHPSFGTRRTDDQKLSIAKSMYSKNRNAIEQVIDLSNRGLSVPQIANKLTIPYYTVRRWLLQKDKLVKIFGGASAEEVV